MGKLPACVQGTNYTNLFLTVEANPLQDAKASKFQLGNILRSFKSIEKCHVSREISKQGYDHHHACINFKKASKWAAICKKIQKEMYFQKGVNETGKPKQISVRAFHTRSGSTENYNDLLSYITEKKYKDSDVDKDGALCVVDQDWCTHCKGKCEKPKWCGCVKCKRCDKNHKGLYRCGLRRHIAVFTIKK